MLDALKFVQGAVATKDYVPALTHFRIQGGTVSGFNGKIALSSPIAIDLECSPRAAPFVNAIEACTDVVQLSLTPAGRLAIYSKGFRAFVDLLGEPYPDLRPEGVPFHVGGYPILPALKRLEPFIADDASKPWSTGVLFDGGSAFATNNIVAIEHWLGFVFPYRINVPRGTIRELLRIGLEPVGYQVTDGSITFHYEGGRWMRSQLNSPEWPDIRKLLEGLSAAGTVGIDEAFWHAISTLTPFVAADGAVYLRPGAISTALEDGAGAHIDFPFTGSEGSFNLRMLQLLEGAATEIGFHSYPRPCYFAGPCLRGAIMGRTVR